MTPKRRFEEPEYLDFETEEDAVADVPIRTFESGATRDTEEGKISYPGILSWQVLQRFGDYMSEHRLQKDGSLRGWANWKLGIPKEAYLQSLFRHLVDVWMMHEQRDDLGDELDCYEDNKILEDALCAILFNAQGYLYEHLNGR